MNFSKLSIPFSAVTGDAHLLLLEVRPNYAYVNGKKTDTLDGYKFTVVEDKTFEKFSVKIATMVPTISQEQIENSKERLYVKFENAFCKPYRTNSGDYDLSITASGISLLKA